MLFLISGLAQISFLGTDCYPFVTGYLFLFVIGVFCDGVVCLCLCRLYIFKCYLGRGVFGLGKCLRELGDGGEWGWRLGRSVLTVLV